MKLNFIPKFLFYSNNVNHIFIKNSYNKLKLINENISNIKRNLNSFFNLNNFILIYFFIGNFFIKNKLKKTLNNILEISNNHYYVSNTNLEFSSKLRKYILDSKNKVYNLNKSIFLIQNQYYFPIDIFNLSYLPYKIMFLYFNIILKFITFFHIKILNLFKLLGKKC